MTTNTINSSDVLSAVTVFVNDNKRPCPAKYLTQIFGDDVTDVIAELKSSGVLLGLRGRNGGLALPNSEIVAKRGEYALRKAAKAAEAAPTVEEVPVVDAEPTSAVG